MFCLLIVRCVLRVGMDLPSSISLFVRTTVVGNMAKWQNASDVGLGKVGVVGGGERDEADLETYPFL